MDQSSSSFIAATVRIFVGRNLAPLMAVLALVAGVAALLVTPREEEPQIVVPMADVIVEAPGLDARQVERLVATRMEKLLYQVDGVEYVYSVSQPNRAVVTARFFVGQDLEDSLIRLHDKLTTSKDRVPPSVQSWIVKPVSIDDVPILAVTLYGSNERASVLRRLAEELELRLQSVPSTGTTRIIGGEPQRLEVEIDAAKLAAYELTPLDIQTALKHSNVRLRAGSLAYDDLNVAVDVTAALSEPEQVRRLVVGMQEQRPVHLEDVAKVVVRADEPSVYTHFGFGPAAPNSVPSELREGGELMSAVTVAVAKRPGANAVVVSRELQKAVDDFREHAFPDGVRAHVTRDYGATADTKVNDLVESLVVALIIVIALITMTLGWREALVVGIAVPITFALTLLVNAIAGYTINRVTLFALILALGLVVDDPIANVDNIQRHMQAAGQRSLQTVIRALQEVLPPVILSTLAIIVSFTPMFFITGMMGPYMAPMAVNVPLAVTFSTITALTVVPWLSHRLIRPKKSRGEKGAQVSTLSAPKDGEASNGDNGNRMQAPPRLTRIFRALMNPLMASRRNRLLVLGGTAAAFVLAVALPVTGLVPLKLLPYDNRNELQLVVDMDEGSTLEETMATTQALARYLREVPEVTDFTTFVGTSSPMDFNGLVRHHYFREGPHQADIRVNLADKHARLQQSHALSLRIRDELKRIAAKSDADLKIVEAPPGPPVLATVTAEVRGAPYHDYDTLADAAEEVADAMRAQLGVVDVDTSLEAPHQRLVFDVDQEKAALNGVAVASVAEVLRVGLQGVEPTLLHVPAEANPLAIRLRLPQPERSAIADLESLRVQGGQGQLVTLSELGSFRQADAETAIYHKNMRPVVYVTGETAGIPPAEAVLSLQSALDGLEEGVEVEWAGEGEWKITLDVFRDLGIAFGVALLGIYILLVYETRNYVLPLVLMIAIPLTVIGIMPGFALLNLIGADPVSGYANPVFFTATAMIGMIGLSGIVVRNSVVLITFIRDAEAEGLSLETAIVRAGAMRLRPIVLTAATTALSSLPITLDPVFSGLAWSLIFGIFVSTAFSLILVPMVYYMVHQNKSAPSAVSEETVASGDGYSLA